jgi:hypothetical protein
VSLQEGFARIDSLNDKGIAVLYQPLQFLALLHIDRICDWGRKVEIERTICRPVYSLNNATTTTCNARIQGIYRSQRNRAADMARKAPLPSGHSFNFSIGWQNQPSNRSHNVASGEALAKPIDSQGGTGILPVFRGGTAHATKGFARTSGFMSFHCERPAQPDVVPPRVNGTVRAVVLPF